MQTDEKEIVIETTSVLPEAQPVERSPVPAMSQVASLNLPGSFMKMPYPVQGSSFYMNAEGVPPSFSPMQSMNEQDLPVYANVNPWYGPKAMSSLPNGIQRQMSDVCCIQSF